MSNTNVMDAKIPWLLFCDKEHEKGSGILCGRCGGHRTMEWSDSHDMSTMVALRAAFTEMKDLHEGCLIRVPKIKDMPALKAMTAAEAFEKATVRWDADGCPQEVRIIYARIGEFAVFATKTGLADPTFSTATYAGKGAGWISYMEYVPSLESPSWFPL